MAVGPSHQGCLVSSSLRGWRAGRGEQKHWAELRWLHWQLPRLPGHLGLSRNSCQCQAWPKALGSSSKSVEKCKEQGHAVTPPLTSFCLSSSAGGRVLSHRKLQQLSTLGGQPGIPEGAQGRGDRSLPEIHHFLPSSTLWLGVVQGRETQWGWVSTEPPLLPGTRERGRAPWASLSSHSFSPQMCQSSLALTASCEVLLGPLPSARAGPTAASLSWTCRTCHGRVQGKLFSCSQHCTDPAPWH